MLEFIESPLFEKYVYDHLSDDQYGELQQFLAAMPSAGKSTTDAIRARMLRALRNELIDP